MRALVDAAIESVNEWRTRLTKNRYVSHARWGDAFPEFLVLWALIPIFFFSMSRSKLPGYILPSLPPLTILTADYLNRLRQEEKAIRPWLLVLHALLAGVTVTVVLLLPWLIFHAVGGMPPMRVLISAIITGIATIMLILVIVGRFGVKRLRIATMVPLMVLVFFLFGAGPFFGLPAIQQTKHTIQLVDLAYSARPLARQLTQLTPHNEPVAVLRVRRDLEFGLSFYRDKRVLDYDKDGVPEQAHILVVRDIALPQLTTLLATRSYHPVFAYPAQHVSVFQVDALGTDDIPASPHK
jgi:hypothetical protein